MPHVKVYFHFVWSTKDRFPYLNSFELREKVWKHMRDNARKKGIFIDFIKGYSDHCHCHVSMGVDQTIKEIAQIDKRRVFFLDK